MALVTICEASHITAKSATSTNLAAGLARQGKRVLVVDCDSQASQTISLGWRQPDELSVTLATLLSSQMERKPTLLSSQMERKPIDPREAILHHDEGIDLLPSSIELSWLEPRMANALNRESLLRKLLMPLKADYDFIILDCPPTLGMITVNALAAADSVIVPVQPEFLSVVGMTQLFDTVEDIREQINPNLKVEGVLITLANMRTNLAKNSVEIIRNAYGGQLKIYPVPVPYSVKVKEASAAGKSIFAYDGSSKAAAAYEFLTREVLADARQRGAIVRDAKTAPER